MFIRFVYDARLSSTYSFKNYNNIIYASVTPKKTLLIEKPTKPKMFHMIYVTQNQRNGKTFVAQIPMLDCSTAWLRMLKIKKK